MTEVFCVIPFLGAQGPGVGAESANARGMWGGQSPPPLRPWGPKSLTMAL